MAEPEALPRVIDRYELLSELGSGGFATVYRARHVLTHQDVAVKLLRPRDPGSDRWLGEARAAAAVQHKNVVRVLDCGRAGDEVFIVMDLVAGPTLADVIADGGPLAPARAVGIALQLLDGVAVAHARGIVHRDIKPPNVILTRDETGADLPKILDFGVSKQLADPSRGVGESSRTLDGTAIGTPGYMAPELFGGAKHADFRADIYALAATLYEMLSGRLPFAAQTYEELVVQVATSRPAPLVHVAPHVPPEIASAVDRGLARDREARWSTAEQFASALRGALVGVAPPSSDAFQATMDARQPTDPSLLGPRVPTLTVPDPSTMRTPPPPVVSTANRNETRSRNVLSWTIAGVALVLVVGGSIAFVGGHFARASSVAAATTATTATTATITPGVSGASSPSRDNDPALDGIETHAEAELPTPKAQRTNHPTSTPHATVGVAAPVLAPTTSGGIRFKFPAQVVGRTRPSAVDALAHRIVPRAQRCRPEHGSPPIVARVRLFVQTEGTISIAQPAGEPGDDDTANCLGALFKEAASPQTFVPGGGGIVVVEAKLDPR